MQLTANTEGCDAACHLWSLVVLRVISVNVANAKCVYALCRDGECCGTQNGKTKKNLKEKKV
jgi:hypothetical protein